MKNFAFDLNCKLSIYIPSTNDVYNTVDNTEITKEVLRHFASLFGGATVDAKNGAWISNNGDLVCESVNVVYSYCTVEQYNKYFSDVVKIAKNLCVYMSQECITFEAVDNTGKIGVKFINQNTNI